MKKKVVTRKKVTITLPEKHVQILDAIAKESGCTRSEIVRRIVDARLEEAKG